MGLGDGRGGFRFAQGMALLGSVLIWLLRRGICRYRCARKMNSSFVHNTVLLVAFCVCFIAMIALLFARQFTKNVSPVTGSVRWLIQILLLVVLFIIMVVLSNYVHDYHIRVSY
jgi:uncharacterized membrane protein